MLSYWINLTNGKGNECYDCFNFLWWNKSNIKEINAILHFAFQINIRLYIINKLKFLGALQNFPNRMGDLPTHKKDLIRTLSFTSRPNSKFEKKVSRHWENALHFAYPHSYNNYVKIVIHKYSSNKAKEYTDLGKTCNSNYISCKLVEDYHFKSWYSWYMSNLSHKKHIVWKHGPF